jgi:hypothetical protein
MPWAQNGKVTMIQRGDSALCESLNYRQDGSVYKAKWQVGVAFKQLPDPRVISPLKLGNLDPTILNISQKCRERSGSEPAGRQPFEFHDNWRRDNNRLGCFRQQSRARGVISIHPIESPVQRPGIAYQRHERGS